jgi:hypothetical protein
LSKKLRILLLQIIKYASLYYIFICQFIFFNKQFKVISANGATVRQQSSLESNFVGKLPQGTIITVSKICDRRAQISNPISGWVSIRNDSNVAILEPLNPSELNE